MKSAQIFIGALPILVVYPYLQRYFVKGMVLGSARQNTARPTWSVQHWWPVTCYLRRGVAPR